MENTVCHALDMKACVFMHWSACWLEMAKAVFPTLFMHIKWPYLHSWWPARPVRTLFATVVNVHIVFAVILPFQFNAAQVLNIISIDSQHCYVYRNLTSDTSAHNNKQWQMRNSLLNYGCEMLEPKLAHCEGGFRQNSSPQWRGMMEILHS